MTRSAEAKRIDRYHSHRGFRELVDHLRSLLSPAAIGCEQLSEQDLVDAQRLAIAMGRGRHDQPVLEAGCPGNHAGLVLPIWSADPRETAALACVPSLWPRRHDSADHRHALRGWLATLRRCRRGQAP